MDLKTTENGKKNIEIQPNKTRLLCGSSVSGEHRPFTEVTLLRELPAINGAVVVSEETCHLA